MKTMNMISRRSFLKATAAAAVVSALGLTGCGSSGSSAAASSTASSAAGSAAAASEAGQTFKVGIVNYVDHASLNQIVASVESRLDELGKEKGVTFDYADYYANAQADQSNLNQIGADLVADGVDVIVAVATPTAATMLAAVEDTDIPVVYSAVTDPVSAGFDGEEGITGTSDALNTEAIMNLITAINPDIDTIGLLYDLSQDASTQAIADAKAFCDSKGIKYIEKNGKLPTCLTMSFAAYIAFYSNNIQELNDKGLVCKRAKGNEYTISDDRYVLEFYNAHKDDDIPTLVHAVMTNEQMWGQDLTKVAGFEEATVKNLTLIREQGAMAAYKSCL